MLVLFLSPVLTCSFLDHEGLFDAPRADSESRPGVVCTYNWTIAVHIPRVDYQQGIPNSIRRHVEILRSSPKTVWDKGLIDSGSSLSDIYGRGMVESDYLLGRGGREWKQGHGSSMSTVHYEADNRHSLRLPLIRSCLHRSLPRYW
jgi:hypothetical protein